MFVYYSCCTEKWGVGQYVQPFNHYTLSVVLTLNSILFCAIYIAHNLGKEVQIIDIYDEGFNKVDHQTHCSSFSLVKFSY